MRAWAMPGRRPVPEPTRPGGATRRRERHQAAQVPALAIRGGTVVDETGEWRADVVCAGGRVAAVGEDLDVPGGATVLDAGGCLVAPGLVHLHVPPRAGERGREMRRNRGARAALGGFTAIVAMPNTEPPLDNAAVASEVLTLGVGAACRVAVAGAITVGRAGERLAPMGELAALGIRLFTDDGAGVQDSGVMRRGPRVRGGLGVTLAEHCEDRALARMQRCTRGSGRACSVCLGRRRRSRSSWWPVT